VTALKQQYSDESKQDVPHETFKFRIKGQVNCFLLCCSSPELIHVCVIAWAVFILINHFIKIHTTNVHASVRIA